MQRASLQGRSWRACSWQRERTHPRRASSRAGPASVQPSYRRSGQPPQRQSFRRSGRVPRPLSLSGLYPQFHSKVGGFPPAHVCPLAGAFGSVYGSRGQDHREGCLQSRSPSQAGFKAFARHPPSRTGPGRRSLGPGSIPHLADREFRRVGFSPPCSVRGRRRDVDRHARTHGRGQRHLLQVGALGARRAWRWLTASTKARMFCGQLVLVEARPCRCRHGSRRPFRP